ncbi:amidase domain-containing protein [Bacillus mycoides]|uniref:amidase domain-containing protein n=1 Tax=Bacillus mycoides TaxID=1405 RepID=UPI0029315386|nr:amidase domain-containing protein [Bacillus mycoides]WOA60642.1 amidase domain-containing protein [Bacillus mycoides]
MIDKKKWAGSIIFSMMLSTFSLSVHAEEKVNSKDIHNPYIQQYINEQKKFKVKEGNNALVNPQIEDQIIKETLHTYYQEDLKVANLIHKLTNDKNLKVQTLSLSKEDKISVMHKIMEMYVSVKNTEEQKTLYSYLERYANSSGDKVSITFLEELTNQQKNELSNLAIADYNGPAAGDWAYNNYNKYSTNYPKFTGNFGTDCTNFVSQAMHVGGGKPQAGNWSISKKNSTYWVINSANELNYSWKLSDPSPWISVKEFSSYWNPKSKVHGMSHDSYRDNHSSVYNRSIYKGDVVVFHKGVAGWVTVPTHLMIISEFDTTNKDFKLAGHSNERQAYPLLSAISDYSYIEILEIP